MDQTNAKYKGFHLAKPFYKLTGNTDKVSRESNTNSTENRLNFAVV